MGQGQKAPPALKVSQARLVHRVLKVIPVLRAHRDHLDSLGQTVPQVLRAHKVILAHRVFKAPQELMEQQAPKVPRGFRAFKVSKAHPDPLVGLTSRLGWLT